jgi:hypothetical protein
MNTKTNTLKNYMLQFSGWVQARMATDPDPSNEPRGVSGYTFSIPGEPDMDQIIYFQPKEGVIQRSHCPPVGVQVTGGYEFITEGTGGYVDFVNKTPITEGHPLFNANVDLLKNPIFDSRNSTIIYSGFGVVNPFILSVEGKGLSINRRFYADPSNEQDDIEQYSIDTLTPFMMNTVIMDSVEEIFLTGVLDRTAFRNERLHLLEKDLAALCAEAIAHPKNKSIPVQIAGLEKRIAELRNNDPENRRTNQIGTQALLNYPLNAKTAVLNKKKINPPAPWPLMLWMGGWDADALGFQVNGYVQIILEG